MTKKTTPKNKRKFLLQEGSEKFEIEAIDREDAEESAKMYNAVVIKENK